MTTVEDWERQQARKNYAKAHMLSFADVCRWDTVSRTLTGSQRTKVQKYLRENLLRKVSDSEYEVLPIPGSTKQHHWLSRGKEGWECDCQYFNKVGKDCSHLMALYLYWNQLREG